MLNVSIYFFLPSFFRCRYIGHSGNDQACQGPASGGFQQQSHTETTGRICSIEEPYHPGIKWHVPELSSSRFRKVCCPIENIKKRGNEWLSLLPGRGNLIWYWDRRALGCITCVLIAVSGLPSSKLFNFSRSACRFDIYPLDYCYSLRGTRFNLYSEFLFFSLSLSLFLFGTHDVRPP